MNSSRSMKAIQLCFFAASFEHSLYQFTYKSSSKRMSTGMSTRMSTGRCHLACRMFVTSTSPESPPETHLKRELRARGEGEVEDAGVNVGLQDPPHRGGVAVLANEERVDPEPPAQLMQFNRL